MPDEWMWALRFFGFVAWLAFAGIGLYYRDAKMYYIGVAAMLYIFVRIIVMDLT